VNSAGALNSVTGVASWFIVGGTSGGGAGSFSHFDMSFLGIYIIGFRRKLLISQITRY